jgi:hypothetical protein
MRTVNFGCMSNEHGHQMLLTRRPVNTEHEQLPEVWISLWRCNVLRTGGVLLEFPGPNDRE